MKSLIKLFVGLIFMPSLSMSQTGTIRVQVQKPCGEAYDRAVKVELYAQVGNDHSLIDSSSLPDAVFNNVHTNGLYQVRVSTEEQAISEPQLLDLVQLQRIILGIDPVSIGAALAGDVNSSVGATTLDLVLLQRHMQGINSQITRKINFVEYNKFYQQDYNYEPETVSIIEVPAGFTDTTFVVVAIEDGKVSDAYPYVCDGCSRDQNDSLRLSGTPISASIGEKVLLNIFAQSINSINGLFLNLGYDDSIAIEKIIPDSKITYNHNEADNSISLIGLFPEGRDRTKPILTVELISLKEGDVFSSFALNHSKKNTMVFQDSSCLKVSDDVSFGPLSVCEVNWPPSLFFFDDCDNLPYTGTPTTDLECEEYTFFSYQDEYIYDADSICRTILRRWVSLNWLNSESSEFVQILKYNPNYSTYCTTDASVYFYDNNPVIIRARDYVQNADMHSIYSFSLDEAGDSTKVVYLSDSESDHLIYNLTDSSYCFVHIEHKSVHDAIGLHNSISVTPNNDLFTVYAVDFIRYGQEFISDIKLAPRGSSQFQSSYSYDRATHRNTLKQYALAYKVQNDWYEMQVSAMLNDTIVNPPLSLFTLELFDDLVVNDQPFTIVFTSPDFDGIVGLQGAIAFKDARVISTSTVSLKDMLFNNSQDKSLFLWVDPIVMGQSFDPTDTLFTITIVPENTTLISNIISLDENALPSEAVLNDLNATKINIAFKFLNRPPTSTEDHVQKSLVSLYPNPTADRRMQLEAPITTPHQIMITDVIGNLIWKEQIRQQQTTLLLPSDVSPGIYHLSISGLELRQTLRFIVVR